MLTVGFLLLRYSIACTVESLSDLIFVLSCFYLNLYVLGNNTTIRARDLSCESNIYRCVLLHIRNKMR